jgi:hypothetical protein
LRIDYPYPYPYSPPNKGGQNPPNISDIRPLPPNGRKSIRVDLESKNPTRYYALKDGDHYYECGECFDGNCKYCWFLSTLDDATLFSHLDKIPNDAPGKPVIILLI